MPAGYIRLCRARKKVIIDPKGTNWEKYRSATIITPNLKELSAVSGMDVRNEDKEIHSAADRILKEYNLTSLLVTRSEKGMSYIAPEVSQDILPKQGKYMTFQVQAILSWQL